MDYFDSTSENDSDSGLLGAGQFRPGLLPVVGLGHIEGTTEVSSRVMIVVLDPKIPSSESNASPLRVIPLKPGIYSTKLLAWNDQYSAWNTWGGVYDPKKHQGWMNSFFIARWTGEGIDQATKLLVGNPRSNVGVFETARDAFEAFPAGFEFRVRGDANAHIPMVFWIVSDYRTELGELRIQVTFEPDRPPFE